MLLGSVWVWVLLLLLLLLLYRRMLDWVLLLWLLLRCGGVECSLIL